MMPCNSDYLEATGWEVAMSTVMALLDELSGNEVKPEYFRGYHPQVYSKNLTKEEGDKLVNLLCSTLKTMDVTRYSLEMQIWWRDHQIADAKRDSAKAFEFLM